MPKFRESENVSFPVLLPDMGKQKLQHHTFTTIRTPFKHTCTYMNTLRSMHFTYHRGHGER